MSIMNEHKHLLKGTFKVAAISIVQFINLLKKTRPIFYI